MSELDDFLSTVIPRYVDVEKAFSSGDVEPRLTMWTRRDPVSVVGAAGPVRTGWTEVEKSFRWIAARFSDCTDYNLDVIADEVRFGAYAREPVGKRTFAAWTAVGGAELEMRVRVDEPRKQHHRAKIFHAIAGHILAPPDAHNPPIADGDGAAPDHGLVHGCDEVGLQNERLGGLHVGIL